MSEPQNGVRDWLANGRLKLLIQVTVFIFLAGAAWMKLNSLETAVARQDVKIEEIRSTVSQTNVSLVKVETRLDERAAVSDRERNALNNRLERLEDAKGWR